MNTRPLVYLIETAMKQHRIEGAAELARKMEGKVSKPSIYSVLAGNTPTKKTYTKLVEFLGISDAVATDAYEEQKSIDRKLAAADKEPKKDSFQLTPWEKRVIKKIRGLSNRGRNAFIFFLERANNED